MRHRLAASGLGSSACAYGVIFGLHVRYLYAASACFLAIRRMSKPAENLPPRAHTGMRCRVVEQLELALEDLLVAVAEEDDAPIDEGQDEPSPEKPPAPALRRRPRVTDVTLRKRRELDPGTCCPDCGGDLRVVGEDVSELLDMIAAQMKVIYYPAVVCLQIMRGQIARIKNSCRRCEKMVQEPAPSRPIPGSMAGPNLLAHVLVSKFDGHLPLYRQHEIFARMGADIPESTLVGWCGRAMKTLSPLIERIEADIMGSDLLHAPPRQIALQSPAGQWTARRSGCWTAQGATKDLAKDLAKVFPPSKQNNPQLHQH